MQQTQWFKSLLLLPVSTYEGKWSSCSAFSLWNKSYLATNSHELCEVYGCYSFKHLEKLYTFDYVCLLLCLRIDLTGIVYKLIVSEHNCFSFM